MSPGGAHAPETVALSGFAGAGFALVYRYSDQHLDAIVHEPNLAIGPGGLTALFPGNSMALLAIPPAGWPTWQAYLPVVAKDAAPRGAGP